MFNVCDSSKISYSIARFVLALSLNIQVTFSINSMFSAYFSSTVVFVSDHVYRWIYKYGPHLGIQVNNCVESLNP